MGACRMVAATAVVALASLSVVSATSAVSPELETGLSGEHTYPTPSPVFREDRLSRAELIKLRAADIENLAKNTDLTIEEATDSFLLSQPIGHFLDRHRDSEGFGSVWVTYDDGALVHVRSTSASFDAEIDELLAELGEIGFTREIERTIGGMSHASMLDARTAVLEEMKRSGGSASEVDFDDRTGTVSFAGDRAEMFTELVPEGRIVDEIIKPIADAAGGAHAGDTWYWLNGSSYTPGCTVGFMIGTYGGAGGHVIAGHCRNDDAYIPGGTYSASPTPWAEDCDPLDYQVILNQAYSGYPVPDNRYRTRLPTGPTYDNFRIAGGAYGGQPALRVGYVSGGDWGNVEEFDVWDGGPFGTHCVPQVSNITTTGLSIDITSAGGDSGGPLLLAYGAHDYHGGVLSLKTGTRSFFTWIGYIPIPSGYHVCHELDACTNIT